MTPYPLFDTNFLFWIGDVEAMVAARLGAGLRTLGIPERQLLAGYHRGLSAARMADDIAMRGLQPAE